MAMATTIRHADAQMHECNRNCDPRARHIAAFRRCGRPHLPPMCCNRSAPCSGRPAAWRPL